jgi:hypothetical protein
VSDIRRTIRADNICIIDKIVDRREMIDMLLKNILVLDYASLVLFRITPRALNLFSSKT